MISGAINLNAEILTLTATDTINLLSTTGGIKTDGPINV